jgi:fatty acid desaturase
MKKAQDWRSLAFLLLTLGFQWGFIFQQRWFGAQVGVLSAVVCFLANVFLVLVTSLINHNHRHCLIFTSSFLNRAMNVLITFGMLAPSTRLHAVHSLNHHRHFANGEDWASYHLVKPDLRGLARTLRYLLSACLLIRRKRTSLQLNSSLRQDLKVERTALAVYVVGLALVAPPWALAWLIGSCATGLLLLLLANLVNHDGCDLVSDHDHSRNFTSSIENFFFFNNGYHTIHHARPGTHWSEYPALHATETRPKMSPSLEHRSFLVHLFTTYLWP